MNPLDRSESIISTLIDTSARCCREIVSLDTKIVQFALSLIKEIGNAFKFLFFSSVNDPNATGHQVEQVNEVKVKQLNEHEFNQLNEWVEDPNATGNKVVAKTLILEAVNRNSICLLLKNLQLNSLPICIGNLVNLTVLDLFKNQLTALPAEIGDLVCLTKLYLHVNQLAALIAEIGNLVNLTHLGLRYNQLTGLPAEIGKLVNLTDLDLSFNKLTDLSAEIGKLVNLTYLRVCDNQITHLPAEIGNLVNLTYLNLRYNQLTGLPAEIGKLVNLRHLDLRGNQLTALPFVLVMMIKKNEINFYAHDHVLNLVNQPILNSIFQLLEEGGNPPQFNQEEMVIIQTWLAGDSCRDHLMNDERRTLTIVLQMIKAMGECEQEKKALLQQMENDEISFHLSTKSAGKVFVPEV